LLPEANIRGIKSHDGKWLVSSCSSSRDTVHFHYGNALMHISLDDLRELGLAVQSVAEDAANSELHDYFNLKKGLV
jgi:hypothetical protein